jgi:hypothetical protein
MTHTVIASMGNGRASKPVKADLDNSQLRRIHPITDINVKWRCAKLARAAHSRKDILDLDETFMRRGDVDGFSWTEVAVLLFNVTSTSLHCS